MGIKTNLLANSIEKFIELFDRIMELSGNNMDKYVNGNILAMRDSGLQEHEEVRQIIELISDICLADGKKTLLDEFEKLNEFQNYKQSVKFIDWMKGYTIGISRPFEETKFIREMDLEEFKDITKYCFQNCILQDIGRENMDTQRWEKQKLFIFRKVLLTFVDMTISKNYGKQKAISETKSVFGLEREYSELFFNLTKQYEEKLWKVFLMRKYNNIEEKLDKILDKFNT